MKVHIDPGHYGLKYNKTTTGLDYYESAMTWKLAGYLKTELIALGVTVTMSRSSSGANPSLYNRGYGAKGCDLFLSLHSNACGTESVDYPIVYRGYDKTDAEEFAMQLATLIKTTMGCNNAAKTATRKGTSGEYYGVLRGARAAGLKYYYIVEHSFHTNKAATQWLMSDANLRKLAKAEAKLIVEYFVNGNKASVTTSTPTTTTTTTSGVKYMYNKLDYSPVFNPTYYANKYSDLKASFGTNATKLFNHFTTYGMKEGRQGIATFNVTAYKNRYADLKTAFGNDLPSYYKHYVEYGKKEGRQGI